MTDAKDPLLSRLDTLIDALARTPTANAPNNAPLPVKKGKMRPLAPLLPPIKSLHGTPDNIPKISVWSHHEDGSLLSYIDGANVRRDILWSNEPFEVEDTYSNIVHRMTTEPRWKGWVIPSLRDYVDSLLCIWLNRPEATDHPSITDYAQQSYFARSFRQDLSTDGIFTSTALDLTGETTSRSEKVRITDYAKFPSSTSRYENLPKEEYVVNAPGERASGVTFQLPRIVSQAARLDPHFTQATGYQWSHKNASTRDSPFYLFWSNYPNAHANGWENPRVKCVARPVRIREMQYK